MNRRIVTVCVVAFFVLLSAAAGSNSQAQNDAGRAASFVPQLVDPGFESFKLANAPLSGWFSDDVMYRNDSRFAGVTMTPDSQVKVEGQYSLRIEQMRPRALGQGQAFLAQAVRLPKRGGATRNFELSVQTRGGMNGPLTIQVYVWDGNVARIIAQRDVKVGSEWEAATLDFKVPEGRDQFGVWFYLPRDDEAQLWLDDVRLTARGK